MQLFIHGRIFTPSDGGSPLAGENQGSLTVHEKGAMLVEDGTITAICRAAALFLVSSIRIPITVLPRFEKASLSRGYRAPLTSRSSGRAAASSPL
jgi:hypothetical protein